MIDFSQFDSLIVMTMYFNNEDTCRQAIVETRWGVGENQDIVCPYCGEHHCAKRKDGKFRCNKCKRNFSCRVGTIFEDSNLSLVKWFIAMYLISSHKKGVSSCQLSRDIKVCQATAWYMLQKIRKLYGHDDAEAFVGDVECDEVYIGGKEKWKHQSMCTPNTQCRSTKTKAPVFGMMERSEIENSKGEMEFMSYVHAMVVGNTKKYTLMPIISQFVVDGAVYTNNIEGFWSHFRRMISGCYHDVSNEHLQSYIDEAVYRWNTRKASQSERFSDMFNKSIVLIVTWSELKLCQVA